MKWHAIFVQRSLDALQPSMSDPSEGEKKCGEVIYMTKQLCFCQLRNSIKGGGRLESEEGFFGDDIVPSTYPNKPQI